MSIVKTPKTWKNCPRVVEKQFRVFREVRSVRAFRLVLCADVSDCMVERAMKILEGVVEAEKVKEGLGNLCEPLIRTTRYGDFQIGRHERWPSYASAL